MLHVTNAAGQHLHRMLRDRDAGPDHAVRIEVDRDSVDARLDRPRANDERYAHKGRTVLLVEPELADSLSERTLDLSDGRSPTRLTLR